MAGRKFSRSFQIKRTQSTLPGVVRSQKIAGILKEIGDEMSKDLTTATNEETTAIKEYEELIAAKRKEIDALTASIETETQRIGELAVSIKQTQNDLTDKDEALLGDEGFLAELEKGRVTRTAESYCIQNGKVRMNSGTPNGNDMSDEIKTVFPDFFEKTQHCKNIRQPIPFK